MLETQEALANGEMVWLSGQSNGKTSIVDAVQELIAVRKQGRLICEPRHEENRQIEFIPRLLWPRSDKLTFQNLIRQIMAQLEIDCSGDRAWRLGLEFDLMLQKKHSNGEKLCLVVDNADMLSRKAFSMLKWFNEYRDHRNRRRIGLSILWAGKIGEVNAPLSFIKHSTEIRVGKIAASEVLHVLTEALPGKVQLFDEKALRRMTLVPETLDVISVAKRSLQVARVAKADQITPEIVDEVMTKLAIAA